MLNKISLSDCSLRPFSSREAVFTALRLEIGFDCHAWDNFFISNTSSSYYIQVYDTNNVRIWLKEKWVGNPGSKRKIQYDLICLNM